ncbi:MAG: response regulator [Gammaproteobacteria bacterium]|nr:response regulator [Gammaproteobacteria bacterium]
MSKIVLVVDDSISIRQVLTMFLKVNGYTVLEAENGQKALEQLNGQPINLIVSDVNMPVMNGLEFVKNARKIKAYQETPVLMLTTETEQDLRNQAESYGVKNWLVKPFQPPMFISAVSQII